MTNSHQGALESRRFTYKGRNLFVLMGAVIVLALAIFGIFMLSYEHGGVLGGETVIVFSMVFVGISFLNSFLMQSDVVITDAEIQWVILGRTRRAIKWRDVKRINIYSLPAIGVTTTYRTFVNIEVADKPIFYLRRTHGIGFDDTIQGFRDLCDLINRYVDLYHIEIIDRNTKPNTRLAQL